MPILIISLPANYMSNLFIPLIFHGTHLAPIDPSGIMPTFFLRYVTYLPILVHSPMPTSLPINYMSTFTIPFTFHDSHSTPTDPYVDVPTFFYVLLLTSLRLHPPILISLSVNYMPNLFIPLTFDGTRLNTCLAIC